MGDVYHRVLMATSLSVSLGSWPPILLLKTWRSWNGKRVRRESRKHAKHSKSSESSKKSERQSASTRTSSKARAARAARASKRQSTTSAYALARPLRGLAGRLELEAFRAFASGFSPGFPAPLASKIFENGPKAIPRHPPNHPEVGRTFSIVSKFSIFLKSPNQK